MKRYILGSVNVLVGVLQLLYLLLSRGVIVVKPFVENGRYTEEFYTLLRGFGLVILLALLVITVLTVITFVKRKKEMENVLGEELVMAGNIISIISLAINGNVTIAFPLCIVGGIIMLVKK